MLRSPEDGAAGGSCPARRRVGPGRPQPPGPAHLLPHSPTQSVSPRLHMRAVASSPVQGYGAVVSSMTTGMPWNSIFTIVCGTVFSSQIAVGMSPLASTLNVSNVPAGTFTCSSPTTL